MEDLMNLFDYSINDVVLSLPKNKKFRFFDTFLKKDDTLYGFYPSDFNDGKRPTINEIYVLTPYRNLVVVRYMLFDCDETTNGRIYYLRDGNMVCGDMYVFNSIEEANKAIDNGINTLLKTYQEKITELLKYVSK